MAFEVHCGKCGARFKLPDDLYDRKVKGRVVTVRCKKCRADIAVDGTKDDAPVEGTPTVPLTGPASLPAVEGLWVVSFGDDDDRELTIAQLKKALEKGEINRETLVWNTSLDEWLTIAEVPALASLVPEDEVGGFLGTGVSVGAEIDLVGEDEIGPFRSVGPGTMSEEPEAKTEPKPEKKPAAEKAPEKVEAKKPKEEAKKGEPPAKADKPEPSEPKSKRPPKPEKKLPTAPPKVRPAWLSDPPPKPPATVDPDLPEGEEPAPSSGTPDLRTLMGVKDSGEQPPSSKSDSVSEDIFAIGGGGIANALPTIDLTNIEPPPSSDPKSSRKRRERDEEAPVSSDRPRSKAKKAEAKPSKDKRPPPAPSARKDRDDKAGAKAAVPAEEEKKGSPAIWLVAAAVGALAVYFLFFRQPSGQGTTEPTARPTAETKIETPPAQPTLAPQPTATETAAPAPSAAPTASKEDAAVAKKEEKPAAKEEPVAKEEKPLAKEEKPVAKEEKPLAKEEKPAATADPSGAPPFDANAARSALASAAGAASGCKQEGEPSGTATVVVTFAPSGRVTSANISGPPFAGTKTGGCIAAAMRGAKVPAFSGDHVTVSKTVTIQ